MDTNPDATAATVPDTTGYEQLKRSIDALQRLYTIVVGLAVTEALRKFIAPTPAAPWWTDWRALIIFLITIVPFYHGANGHLDQTYLYGFDGRRREKRYALVIDFGRGQFRDKLRAVGDEFRHFEVGKQRAFLD